MKKVEKKFRDVRLIKAMKKLIILTISILLLSGLVLAKEKKKVDYKKRTILDYKIEKNFGKVVKKSTGKSITK